MRAASLAFAAGALLAPGKASNRTEVVTVTNTAYTTYCPGPTTISIGNATYTVREATTLTITDCPCVLTESGRHEPTATARPGCPPGAEDCARGGHECDGEDCSGDGSNGAGRECSGEDCGSDASDGSQAQPAAGTHVAVAGAGVGVGHPSAVLAAAAAAAAGFAALVL
ncbi:uncharacterized protein MAM_03785 [Metarhizium album ARSEF 1941]|uniref:Clock-controlled protein 6 n=1 Tax=Metarhizium album (strain ARSEF 1941) TaxID=1081103 RepID=A0A0B2WRH5_METAS|nr:uncharacterized protein MAM_03785 [Metarhizium album ARSEF 1941]KHN98661.1 hypothetical protein MAM_03785 [Metarhizium album ARSEF 1941]